MLIRKTLGLLLATVVFSASYAVPSQADSNKVSDPQDMPAGTPLDIASVSVATHRRAHDFGIGTPKRQHLLSFRIDTYDAFDDSDLEDVDAEFPALSLHFDLNHDGKFERMLFIQAIPDATGYEIKAEMTRGKPIHKYQIGDRLVGYAEVWRPTTSSVMVEFPYSLIALDPHERFRWQARAASESRPGEIDIDYAPNSGLVRQEG